MNKCPASAKDMHTQGSAITAALRYSKKRGTPLRVYFCHQCRHYHLTKKPLMGYVDNLREGSESA